LDTFTRLSYLQKECCIPAVATQEERQPVMSIDLLKRLLEKNKNEKEINAFFLLTFYIAFIPLIL
jgi:hypothetical protein